MGGNYMRKYGTYTYIHVLKVSFYGTIDHLSGSGTLSWNQIIAKSKKFPALKISKSNKYVSRSYGEKWKENLYSLDYLCGNICRMK